MPRFPRESRGSARHNTIQQQGKPCRHVCGLQIEENRLSCSDSLYIISRDSVGGEKQEQMHLLERPLRQFDGRLCLQRRMVWKKLPVLSAKVGFLPKFFHREKLVSLNSNKTSMRKQICRLDEKKKPTNFLNTRLLLKELRATRNTQVTNTDLVFAYLNISAFIKS